MQIHEIESLLSLPVLNFSEFSYSVRIFILKFSKMPNFKVFWCLRWIWNTTQCNLNMLWVCTTNYWLQQVSIWQCQSHFQKSKHHYSASNFVLFVLGFQNMLFRRSWYLAEWIAFLWFQISYEYYQITSKWIHEFSFRMSINIRKFLITKASLEFPDVIFRVE